MPYPYRHALFTVALLAFVLLQFPACRRNESGSQPEGQKGPMERPASVTPAQWAADWASRLPVEASVIRGTRHKLPILSEPQTRTFYKVSIRLKNQTGYKISAQESLFLVETSSKDPKAKPGSVLQVTGASFKTSPTEDYSGCAEVLPQEEQNELVTVFVMSSTWEGLQLHNAQTRSRNGGYVRVLASYIEREDGLPGAAGPQTYGSADPGQTIAAETELELWVVVNPARLDQVVVISPVITVGSGTAQSARFRYLLVFSKPAGLSGAWPLSERRLLPLSDESLAALIGEGPEWQRVAGAAWASKYGKREAEAALARAAGSPSESDNIRAVALVSLARLKSKEGLAQAQAIASSSSAAPEVREAAVRSLGTYEDPSAVSSLVPLLNEKNEDLVREAIDSLGRLKDPKSVQALLGVLQDAARSKYYESVGRALQKVAGPADLPLLLSIAAKAAGPSTAAAVTAIGGIDSPEALHALQEFAVSATPKMRAAACDGLALLAKPQAIETLDKLTGDPAAEVRSAAIRAILGLKDRSQRMAAIHRAAASRYPEVLTDVINHGSYVKELVPDVVSVLARMEVADEIRVRAAEELGNALPPSAVDGLLAALKDKTPAVRKAAAEAVGGFRDPRIVDALSPLLSDKDFDVQTGAATGLGRTRDPRAFEPLLHYARAEGFAQEQAVGSLGKLNDPRAIEPLMGWVQGDLANTSHPAGEALERLTGEGFGRDKAQWARWWRENKSKFAASAPTPAAK